MAAKLIVIAHDLRSAHNVGALFRTADGAGAAKLYLTGYTPRPALKKHFLTQAEKALAKTALGAEKALPWEYQEDVQELVSALKQEGYVLLALEQDARSADYRLPPPEGPVALLVGNEVEGLPEALLSQADRILEIPMRGTKHSLNVSVAAGVALYQITGTMGGYPSLVS
jgi:tRNA G18 (ribose-2'-O)-methylase SpoU